MADLPTRIGPAEFSVLGGLIVIRCPHNLMRGVEDLRDGLARRFY